MRLEKREFKSDGVIVRTNIVLITEDSDDCDLLDALANSTKVGEDGIIHKGEYRTKLADGYGEYYLLIEGELNA